MATVKPFRAFHYNSNKVKIDKTVAPPYDVISAEEEQIYHDRDPHNIIRLILGQSTPSRPRPDQAYEDAKNYINQWIQEKVLIQPDQDAYYLYEMTYEHPFQKVMLTRLSFFAALKLEPFENKVVFPHERTHATAKVDRAKLLNATHANYSPIFMLYEDPSGTFEKVYGNAKKQTPLFDFTDEKKTKHRLWVIQDEAGVGQIKGMFDGKGVFIADGHHRYETALKYGQEHGGGTITGQKPSDYVLSCFVKFNDPGLLILPIHRLLSKSVPVAKDKFLNDLKSYFNVKSVSRDALEKISQGKVQTEIGLAFNEKECYTLELKDKAAAKKLMPAGKPELWYNLQMTVVSYVILKTLLKIEEANLEKSVTYTASTDEAFGKLSKQEINAAFFICPTTPEAIKEICEGGEVMPQKSTFFYPKFPSGLVIYKHENAFKPQLVR